jgi:hypothetical protein
MAYDVHGYFEQTEPWHQSHCCSRQKKYVPFLRGESPKEAIQLSERNFDVKKEVLKEASFRQHK